MIVVFIMFVSDLPSWRTTVLQNSNRLGNQQMINLILMENQFSHVIMYKSTSFSFKLSIKAN